MDQNTNKHRSGKTGKATGTVVDCGEQLDITTAADLHAVLQKALEGGKGILIQASDVTRVDTAGVQLLAALAREAQRSGTPVQWRGLPEILRQTARDLGMENHFT